MVRPAERYSTMCKCDKAIWIEQQSINRQTMVAPAGDKMASPTSGYATVAPPAVPRWRSRASRVLSRRTSAIWRQQRTARRAAQYHKQYQRTIDEAVAEFSRSRSASSRRGVTTLW